MRKPTILTLTMSNTNQAVQLQKQARSLNFQICKKRDCTIIVAKTLAIDASHQVSLKSVLVSEKKIFEGFLPYMGMAAILIM